MHMRGVWFVSKKSFERLERLWPSAYVDYERNNQLFRILDIDGYYIAPEFFREAMRPTEEINGHS